LIIFKKYYAPQRSIKDAGIVGFIHL